MAARRIANKIAVHKKESRVRAAESTAIRLPRPANLCHQIAAKLGSANCHRQVAEIGRIVVESRSSASGKIAIEFAIIELRIAERRSHVEPATVIVSLVVCKDAAIDRRRGKL